MKDGTALYPSATDSPSAVLAATLLKPGLGPAVSGLFVLAQADKAPKTGASATIMLPCKTIRREGSLIS
jgi:hypothetical protein